MKVSEISWQNVALVGGYHLLAFILVPIYLISRRPSSVLLLLSLLLFILCALSITAGYHRFYSHNAYKLNKSAEAVLLFFGTLAFASEALKWSHDHRIHHRHVDTDKDPYSVKDGFWHAHMLWIFKKRKEFKPEVVRDLMRNKFVMFQNKYYLPLVFGTNILMWLLVGWIVNDYFGAFVFAIVVRIFFTHHAMYSINSFAHWWGVQPYSREHTAVNNWLISLVTFGEGFHNFHHAFEYDYRNGLRWYQWDPTKMLIWTLHKLGLATHLRKADRWAIRKKLVLEDKKLLLAKAQKLGKDSWKELEIKITAIAERLTTNLNSMREKKNEYMQLKKQHPSKSEKYEAKLEMKGLKKSLNQDYRSWDELCNRFLSGH